MNIVLLGAPGAGKGTQAALLKKEFSVPHISTGHIFRENIKRRTELGITANAFIEKGMLVPDGIVLGLIEKRLSETDCENGFVLDGFPRTIIQAQELESIAKIDYCINIYMIVTALTQRLSGRRVCGGCGASYNIADKPYDFCPACGGELIMRDDDKPETVKARLAVYETQTAPLIEYYKDKGLLITVDGNQEVEKVFLEIKKAVA